MPSTMKDHAAVVKTIQTTKTIQKKTKTIQKKTKTIQKKTKILKMEEEEDAWSMSWKEARDKLKQDKKSFVDKMRMGREKKRAEEKESRAQRMKEMEEKGITNYDEYGALCLMSLSESRKACGGLRLPSSVSISKTEKKVAAFNCVVLREIKEVEENNYKKKFLKRINAPWCCNCIDTYMTWDPAEYEYYCSECGYSHM